MNNKFNETCTITSELTTEVNFNKNDIKEFELMSETLSSINFEDKLTDGQYVAICYFATLHNVTPFDVVGIDGKEAVERYMRSLNDDVDVSIDECMAEFAEKHLRAFAKELGMTFEVLVGKPAETMALKSPHSRPEDMTTQILVNEKWETVRVNDLKSKASDTKDATRKFREAGIKKASELVDK